MLVGNGGMMNMMTVYVHFLFIPVGEFTLHI